MYEKYYSLKRETIIDGLKKCKKDKNFCKRYLNLGKVDNKELKWEFIRAAFASVADLAVIPMQDYLGLGSEARINTPSTLGDNWKWRMKKDAFTDKLAKEMKEMTKLYGRLQKEEKEIAAE